MADDAIKTEDYFENENDRKKGHVNTRGAYEKENCDNPDPNLGCDLDIDVAG